MEEKMKYFASCSFGKDSVATILLALEHNEPLDGVIFSEVVFDHSRNISGEIPEHIEWIRNTAIPTLESMGVMTTIVKSNKDYMADFFTEVKNGKRKGKLRGFPIGGLCTINRDCKVPPIKKYLKDLGNEYTCYIGIATDEPKRLARLKSNQISLLAKYGYTEQMALELCKKYNLLSPLYKKGKRGGCWFCPNATLSSFADIKYYHPELWSELEVLSKTENLCSNTFRWGQTFPEVNKKINEIIAEREKQMSLSFE